MLNHTQIAAITNPILQGATGGNAAGAQTSAESGSLFFAIISGALQFMMIVGVILVLINLLQSGIEWISGGGDNSKLEKARSRITNSLLGLFLLSGSFAIWLLIKNFLGIKITFGPLFP